MFLARSLVDGKTLKHVGSYETFDRVALKKKKKKVTTKAHRMRASYAIIEHLIVI